MQCGRRSQQLGGLCIGAIMCALPLSACSSSGSTASPPFDSSQAPQPDATEVDEPHRNDLTNERAVDWERHEIVDENSIRVFFTAGTSSCFGARAVVEETDTAVEIAVIEGTFPDAPGACTLEARGATILVETEQPVADRDVVQLADPELH